MPIIVFPLFVMLNVKWLREHTRIPRIIIEFVDDFDNYSVSFSYSLVWVSLRPHVKKAPELLIFARE